MLHTARPNHPPTGGFSFENTRRNAVLEGNLSEVGYSAPKARKTGTTIAGILFKLLWGGRGRGRRDHHSDDVIQRGAARAQYGAPATRRHGSGAASAISVFEDRYKPDMELEEAKQLVRDAITAGIFCDLGSGSNVDLCVITQAGVQYLRGYDQPAQKGRKQGQYRYKPGTTAVLTEKVTPLPLHVVDESVQLMDTQ
ncbi:hypothetical protein JZ751_016920 [Albula glossodonta]|uniref:Proteasome beta subunit C-terminal domain-containing protein n=1 Tax=Albula glossodonta TaxID=121402 RepID=A0A8T2MQP2_9TELE|nr:hypothetical protein JZ751_016920 [Albula glossodonta]